MAKTTAQRMREYRARHRERIRESERERLRTRRENGWREDPLKKRARNAVASAVRRGKLTPQPCEVCGASPTEAHHDDYSKPLDVRWLCEPHHEKEHPR